MLDEIVDSRSSTLSSAKMHIGNEKVVIVNSDHVNLCRFGDNPNAPTLKQYVNDLRVLIDELGSMEKQGTSWRENTLTDDVMAEIHLFYEIQEAAPDNVIRLFSQEKISLADLCHEGPTACLRRRLTRFRRGSLVPYMHSETRRNLETRRSSGSQSLQSSQLSAPAMVIPSIQINGELVESGPYVEPEKAPAIKTTNPHPNLQTPVPSLTAEVARLPTPENDRVEEQVRIRSRRDLYELPTPSSQKFRWIRVPCLNMMFVPKVLRAIAEEAKDPRLMTQLLHKDVFDSKQNIARHSKPHGRYMRTFFQAIFEKPVPKSREKSLAPTADTQYVLYVCALPPRGVLICFC
jgi:hypothetical protein